MTKKKELDENEISELLEDVHAISSFKEEEYRQLVDAILIQSISLVEQLASEAIFIDPIKVVECIKGIESMSTIDLGKTVENGYMTYNN